MPILRQPVDPAKSAQARLLRKQMTPAEQSLWQALRANRLHGWHFRRQQVIAGFIVDFYCHAARLVIEVDGPVHANQQEQDAAREQALLGLGYKIIRFTNAKVENGLEDVLERISQAIQVNHV